MAAACALLLTGLSCNKGAAEESLHEAEGAVEDARTHLERYAPEELAALRETLEQARADLDAGHYTRALRAGQELPARIRSARAMADRRRERMAGEWDELSPRVATLIGELRGRIGRLLADRGAPATPPDARMRAARNELRVLVEEWGEATAAHEKGDVPRAVRTARDVHARARDLAGTLGLATVPQPAEAGDRAAPE